MSRKMNGSAAGKGYYIALILCAVAIGISGYLYYKNANSDPAQQANEPAAVTGGKDVPAVATKPTIIAENRIPAGGGDRSGVCHGRPGL